MVVEGYPVGSREFRKNKEPIGWRIKFQWKNYLVHRIIWVLTHGSIDSKLIIDHLDGNPFNNMVENLSLKTPSGNSMNKRKYANNKTGVTGVYLADDGKGNSYYQAQWYEINGDRKVKSFPINNLGEDVAKESAIIYREEQIQRLVAEGAAYTDRHGV